MTENPNTTEQSRVAADCPNERVVMRLEVNDTTTKSKWRGHEIETRAGSWLYADTGVLVSDEPERKCGHCGAENRGDGHDACIAELPGVTNACCGHGSIEDSYIQFSNGVTVRGFVKDA